jgi:hypothetical protein
MRSTPCDHHSRPHDHGRDLIAEHGGEPDPEHDVQRDHGGQPGHPRPQAGVGDGHLDPLAPHPGQTDREHRRSGGQCHRQASQGGGGELGGHHPATRRGDQEGGGGGAVTEL